MIFNFWAAPPCVHSRTVLIRRPELAQHNSISYRHTPALPPAEPCHERQPAQVTRVSRAQDGGGDERKPIATTAALSVNQALSPARVLLVGVNDEVWGGAPRGAGIGCLPV